MHTPRPAHLTAGTPPVADGSPRGFRREAARRVRLRPGLVPSAVRLVAVGAAVAVTSGCLAHVDMTISQDGTYDVVMDLRDSTGSVFDPATSEQERCASLADPSLVGASADATVTAEPVGAADDASGVGCRVTVTGVPVAADEAAATSSPAADGTGAGGSSALVWRDGDVYVVDLSEAASLLTASAPDGDGAGDGAGDGSGTQGEGASTAAPSDGATPAAPAPSAQATTDPSDAAAASVVEQAIDVSVSVTFPGAVVDSGGGEVSSSGRTVTWSGSESVAAGVRASGYASTGRGVSWWARHGTAVAVVAVGAAVVCGLGVVWRARRRRTLR